MRTDAVRWVLPVGGHAAGNSSYGTSRTPLALGGQVARASTWNAGLSACHVYWARGLSRVLGLLLIFCVIVVLS